MKRERKAAAEAVGATGEPMETEPAKVEEKVEQPKEEEIEPKPKKVKQVFAKNYEKVPRLFPLKMKKLQPKRNQ
jgi:hypothetical protein